MTAVTTRNKWPKCTYSLFHFWINCKLQIAIVHQQFLCCLVCCRNWIYILSTLSKSAVSNRNDIQYCHYLPYNFVLVICHYVVHHNKELQSFSFSRFNTTNNWLREMFIREYIPIPVPKMLNFNCGQMQSNSVMKCKGFVSYYFTVRIWNVAVISLVSSHQNESPSFELFREYWSLRKMVEKAIWFNSIWRMKTQRGCSKTCR